MSCKITDIFLIKKQLYISIFIIYRLITWLIAPRYPIRFTILVVFSLINRSDCLFLALMLLWKSNFFWTLGSFPWWKWPVIAMIVKFILIQSISRHIVYRIVIIIYESCRHWPLGLTVLLGTSCLKRLNFISIWLFLLFVIQWKWISCFVTSSLLIHRDRALFKFLAPTHFKKSLLDDLPFNMWRLRRCCPWYFIFTL